MLLVLAIGITVLALVAGGLYWLWADKFYFPPAARKYKGMDPDKIENR